MRFRDKSRASFSELPELREFIKENDQRLYDFCSYLLHGMLGVEDSILAIFREFGDYFRKRAARRRDDWETSEIRIELFRSAWERVRELVGHQGYDVSEGRDTRTLREWDFDVLGRWEQTGAAWEGLDAAVLERLARLDLDFRAPLVLRDVLRFEDEEVMRILSLRWGVYRHRLHRGRLELREALRGAPASAASPSLSPELPA